MEQRNTQWHTGKDFSGKIQIYFWPNFNPPKMLQIGQNVVCGGDKNIQIYPALGPH